jgi:hypothetical protein
MTQGTKRRAFQVKGGLKPKDADGIKTMLAEASRMMKMTKRSHE